MEHQFAISRLFGFRTVYRVGLLEVLEVIPKDRATSSSDMCWSEEAAADVVLREGKVRRRRSFREGIQLLENRRYEEAHARFKSLWKETGGSASAVILTGVALAFSGQFDQAEDVFRAFLEQPQSGDFLDEAWFHRELLSRLRAIRSDTSHTSRAFTYYGVAANYWEAGYRTRAIEMVRLSLSEDSCYQRALNFGLLLGLQGGDTAFARGLILDRPCTGQSEGTDLLRRALLQYIDSLQTSADSHRRAELRYEIAGLYERLGFPEAALMELHRLVREYPSHVKSLTSIAMMYERRNRRALALRAWRNVLVAEPGSPLALQRMSELARSR